MTNHPEHIDLLIRYSDGNATPEEIGKALEVLRNDQSAAQFFASLRAADLPVKDAYDRVLIEAPAIVTNLLESEAGTWNKTNVSRWWSQPLVATACLAVGLFAGTFLAQHLSFNRQIPTIATQYPSWVKLIADYHSLYTRATLSSVGAQSIEDATPMARELLKVPFSIPDLSASGYEFRRSQPLALANQPLLQLAYLPSDNLMPLALCVLKVTQDAHLPLETGNDGHGQYAYWQNGHLAYAVIGDLSDSKFHELAEFLYRTVSDS